MSNPNPAEGDGAARIPLSDAIGPILALLNRCRNDLNRIQTRLQSGSNLQDELPGTPDSEQRPAVHARQVAVHLESCAKALRNASGQTGRSSK